ncbi:MAG: dihydropteroate synthase [Candidatus Thorarchaeota archaeon]|jgi:dihydropteroate synthase
MDKDILPLNGLSIGGTNPVRVMGVINLSPESFYSGSVATDAKDILAKVKEMTDAGVDILDIGAASTAPKNYYETVDTSRDDEISRVTSYMSLISKNTDIPISIDTTSAAVAEIALDLGASIVNDVSGLNEDPKMAGLVADKDIPIVIMAHCTEACKSVNDSFATLQRSMTIADDAGIQRANIIVDPGIGFGKPHTVDLAILKNLNRFKEFERPLLVGVSRKAFIGAVLKEENPENRLIGSLAATAIAVANGADVIRTHDVRETKIAISIGESIR